MKSVTYVTLIIIITTTTTTTTTTIFIFEALGLLACSCSEFISRNLWIYWTVGRTPWTGDQPDARPLPTRKTTQHRKTRTYIQATTPPFTFFKSGWSIVKSASLAKGGTPKKRPSPHLHKDPTRSNKVSPRTFQTALVPTQS
jgi:hypothetical protein